MLMRQMLTIDEAQTIDSLLSLIRSEQVSKMAAKVILLEKLSKKLGQVEKNQFKSGENRQDDKNVREKVVKSMEFQVLIKDIKLNFLENRDMSDFKRNNVLHSLLQMRFRDEELLDLACAGVLKNPRTNSQAITNLLYFLAKFKYLPLSPDGSEKNLFLGKCCAILKAEPVIPLDKTCRNLWNLYALDHYDPELFDKFGEIIVKNHT